MAKYRIVKKGKVYWIEKLFEERVGFIVRETRTEWKPLGRNFYDHPYPYTWRRTDFRSFKTAKKAIEELIAHDIQEAAPEEVVFETD